MKLNYGIMKEKIIYKMNNKNNFNKKSNTTFIFVTIIISLLSFFVVLNNFILIGDKVVSNSNDLACRYYISLKSKTSIKFYDFFNQINKKCKNDEIKIKDDEPNIIFKKIAEESKRCWYRYGEGKKDFLSNYGTTGSWCFTCGKIIFDKNINKIYSYNDFIKWSDTHKIKLNNGSRVVYSKTFNMKYSNVSKKDLDEIKVSLQEIQTDTETKDLALLFSEQYEKLSDLRLKKIDSNNNLYIVYRYDRMNLSESQDNALYGTIEGVGIGLGLDMLASQILWTIGTAAVCGASGIATVGTGGLASPTLALCAVMTGKTIASYADKAVDISKKISKVRKLSIKLTNSFKSTNKLYRVKKSLGFFTGKVDDIALIGEKLSSKSGDLGRVGEKLIDIHKDLKILNIKNIDDIGENIIKNKNNLKNIQKITDKAIDMDLLNNPALRKLAEKEIKYSKTILELKNIEKELKNIDYNKLKKVENLKKVKTYFKGIGFLTAGLIGHEIGSNFNFNSNQYVDLMTEEQYYRLCGFEPKIK